MYSLVKVHGVIVSVVFRKATGMYMHLDWYLLVFLVPILYMAEDMHRS